VNLLRRLVEAGGGRTLSLTNAADPAANPFLHDRQRTFQPRDLWEWLLQLALFLFVADVGVRRIYLDRAEWLTATATLRRYLFFWRGKARPVGADESLGALLARRDAVRARHTPPAAPSPELFQPARPETAILPPSETLAVPKTAPEAPPPAATDRTNVTSRLLDAKRRASRKLDQ
jgi:hypothetical protein